MTRRGVSDPVVDDMVVQSRQAYRKVLARHGLLAFTAKEVSQARALAQEQDRSRINPEDIRFQACVNRLRARNLTRKALDDAVKELIEAEGECDQARWERDCHIAAMMTHSCFKSGHGG